MTGRAVVAALPELLDRWQADLAAWAIPDHITATVPDSPWVLPREVFARRADRQHQGPGGPSYERAWEALAPAGSVLDVGCGGGAASLPLGPAITELTLVDADEAMLGMAAERARAAGISTRPVAGRWPDVAGEIPPADVVTCYNVLYNVPDLGPFLTALTSHARRRVVAEITAGHPLASLNPLWQRFWGLTRPQNPTSYDVLDILAAMSVRARQTKWSRPAEADYHSMAELVEVTRRRLCLPPDRAGEVEAALLAAGADHGRPGDLGTSGRDVVTMWWEDTP
ncbi:MAG: methyltransferase domain-containing protein [Nocardiopsaceae bacterium]|nr:methyltransferase domain-containing protein [Nocardiopsaceae bacterium]